MLPPRASNRDDCNQCSECTVHREDIRRVVKMSQMLCGSRSATSSSMKYVPRPENSQLNKEAPQQATPLIGIYLSLKATKMVFLFINSLLSTCSFCACYSTSLLLSPPCLVLETCGDLSFSSTKGAMSLSVSTIHPRG